MKKYMITGLLAFGILSAQGQNTTDAQRTIQEGDLIEMGTPSTGDYKYVKFPKRNFIIKKGGIPTMKALDGEQVIVTRVTTTKNDATKIRVKRKNGKKFFNAVGSVTILFEDALGAGEISFNDQN